MKTFALLISGAVLALPALTFASTYHYVDMSGEVQDVEANTSAEALTLSQADRAPDSGVALDLGVIDEGDMVVNVDYQNTYQYVATDGDVEFVTATSAEAALMIPSDIAPTSGVLNLEVASEPIDPSMEVPL